MFLAQHIMMEVFNVASLRTKTIMDTYKKDLLNTVIETDIYFI